MAIDVQLTEFPVTYPPGTHAWKYSFPTMDPSGAASTGTAVLFSLDSQTKLKPVVLWLHGTTGVSISCEPAALGMVSIPVLAEVLHAGYDVVAPDYMDMKGKGITPYMVGEGEARSAFDALRALLGAPRPLIANEVVAWGLSQGGHAALWVGMQAKAVAPELNISGIVAIAPVSNFAKQLGQKLGGIGSALILTAYVAAYDDVHLEDYLDPDSFELVEEFVDYCLMKASVKDVQDGLWGKNLLLKEPLGWGALGRHAEENTPSADVGGIPLLVVQGEADTTVIPVDTKEWVDKQRAAGYPIEYRTYPGLDHNTVTLECVDELLSWTNEKIAHPLVSPPTLQ